MMNSTIQQIEANKKFEKILNLFEDIAPGNQKVQKQIATLTNSKENFIKKLQTQWLSMKVPKFTELEIREINQTYFMDLERINELRYIQGLEKITLVDSRNWVIKSEHCWSGWDPEAGAYMTDPLLYQGTVNYKKIFEPLVVSDKNSNSINLIWTLEKILKCGSKIGLSSENWITVFLTLAKEHMPHDFQTLTRHSDNVDNLFMQLTASINSDHEISKIRTSLGQISRKPQELLQTSLYQILSFYTMLLSIEYPSMTESAIRLKADHYSCISAIHLVSKNTGAIINQFVALRQQESENVSVLSITNLVTSHEAQNQGDKATTVLYLPESCTRLDKQASQAESVQDLVLATSRLTLNKNRDRKSFSRSYSRDRKNSRSGSRNRDDRKYRESRDRNQKSKYRNEQNDRRFSSKNREKSYDRSSSHDKGRNDRRKNSQSQRYSRYDSKDKKYERRDSSDNVKKQYPRRSSSNKKYETRDRSVSKKREQSPRNTNCLRCGGAHLSSSCKKYDFYNGAPCTKCEFLHATADHRGKRQNSIEKKPKKEYSIPDHRYRDPYDGIFSTSVIKSDGTPENIFRDTKN
jgi:hypothetical protein